MFIMQEAQAAGCRTSVEAETYLDQKRKRETEENARRTKESPRVAASSQGGPNPFMASDSKDTDSRPTGQAASSFIGDMNIMSFNGADLLSEAVSIQ